MNGYNMKTIEERADRAIYEPTDGHPLKTCEVVAFARGYELGATEQKAINDELCAGLWVKIDAGHPLPYGQRDFVPKIWSCLRCGSNCGWHAGGYGGYANYGILHNAYLAVPTTLYK